MTKSEKPALLVYHPKAVFAGANAKAATIGADAELEIVPVSEKGKTRFQLLAKGLPVANAEGSAMFPVGAKEALTTDKDGYTATFEKTGRIAVYLKRTETKSGEYGGKTYEEVRHYATLVVEVAK